jgi:hypothetical protein
MCWRPVVDVEEAPGLGDEQLGFAVGEDAKRRQGLTCVGVVLVCKPVEDLQGPRVYKAGTQTVW